MKTIYATSATATHEARNGSVRSADGKLDVSLAMPPELGGNGQGTNPEQLFAAGYAACFTSAIQRVSREGKIAIGKPQVTVHSGLNSDGPNRFALFAHLEIALPEATRADAEQVIAGAHQICPFSKATRGNIDVTITLTAWAEASNGETLELDAA